MSAIQEIFSRFAPAYVAHFGALMPKTHQRVINAIIACRTGALGSVCFACGKCGCRHVTAASCGNRHCPICQGAKAFAWLDRQIEQQLPGPHFMLTFTVPEALRGVLRANQKVGYGALFAASAEALKTLAKDTRLQAPGNYFDAEFRPLSSCRATKTPRVCYCPTCGHILFAFFWGVK